MFFVDVNSTGSLPCTLTLRILTWGGQGDLTGRLMLGIVGVILWVIGIINLLTKSP